MAKHWGTANERFAFFQRVLTMVEGPPKRTLRDVGAELDLSVERVRMIAKEALAQREAQKSARNPTNESEPSNG